MSLLDIVFNIRNEHKTSNGKRILLCISFFPKQKKFANQWNYILGGSSLIHLFPNYIEANTNKQVIKIRL